MATTTAEAANSDQKSAEEPSAGLRRRKFVECAQDTLEQASELLKQKIPCVGHILAPKRLWLKRISTPNCDVVTVFPPNTEDAVLLWLLSRLRQATGGGGGLSVHVRHHTSTQSSAFYLTASFQILLRAAEEYHLPKALKSTKGGGLKEFAYHDLQSFEGADSEDTFFTSQERQWLVLRLLESIRAKASDTKALPGIVLLEGQPIVPKCLSAGVISEVFPLHEPASIEKLQVGWVRDISSKQPLDDIAEYFGVKIAMYFAWLGHYTTALGIPGIVGFIFWLCCTGKNQNLEDLGYVLFSLFNIVWVTSYTQAWKRYSAELAFRWGTLDQRADLLAEPRPLFRKSRDSDRSNLFQGPLEQSPVTGRLEPWQPAWRRYVYRYFVTVPIIAVCLCAVFFVMIVSLRIQDWWDYQLEQRGYPNWLGYLPKILLAVVITVMDEGYFKIAIWLNDNVSIYQLLSIIVLHRILPSGPSSIKGATSGAVYIAASDWQLEGICSTVRVGTYALG